MQVDPVIFNCVCCATVNPHLRILQLLVPDKDIGTVVGLDIHRIYFFGLLLPS